MVKVSRHKSMDTLWGYVRRADLFREHAGAAFLLAREYASPSIPMYAQR